MKRFLMLTFFHLYQRELSLLIFRRGHPPPVWMAGSSTRSRHQSAESNTSWTNRCRIPPVHHCSPWRCSSHVVQLFSLVLARSAVCDGCRTCGSWSCSLTFQASSLDLKPSPWSRSHSCTCFPLTPPSPPRSSLLPLLVIGGLSASYSLRDEFPLDILYSDSM